MRQTTAAIHGVAYHAACDADRGIAEYDTRGVVEIALDVLSRTTTTSDYATRIDMIGSGLFVGIDSKFRQSVSLTHDATDHLNGSVAPHMAVVATTENSTYDISIIADFQICSIHIGKGQRSLTTSHTQATAIHVATDDINLRYAILFLTYLSTADVDLSQTACICIICRSRSGDPAHVSHFAAAVHVAFHKGFARDVNLSVFHTTEVLS